MALEIELTTGLIATGFHKPRKKDPVVADQHADIGMKAKTFALCLAAAEKVLGAPLMPTNGASRSLSLAPLGLFPVAGFKRRAMFAGRENTGRLVRRSKGTDLVEETGVTRRSRLERPTRRLSVLGATDSG